MKNIILILLALILFGCSEKKNSENNLVTNPSEEFAPGEVAFGIKDSVSLERFAAYIYSLNDITINSVVFFEYSLNLPQDSIQILKSLLESKQYIDSGSVSVSYIEEAQKTILKFSIGKFNSEDQSDWQSLVKQFNLSHYPNYFQLGILKVRVGKEKEWINYLSDKELFRFVELNYVTYAH
ncbi:MAG: hypothetical protein K8F60_03900 [Melioribacteraceae bacterium]|nr:hypothetical protein [Melioribacteraceae bacterium]